MDFLSLLVDIATVIGLLYGTFFKTWRQKEAMEESSRVKRLLISNASHEGRFLSTLPLKIDLLLSNSSFQVAKLSSTHTSELDHQLSGINS